MSDKSTTVKGLRYSGVPLRDIIRDLNEHRDRILTVTDEISLLPPALKRALKRSKVEIRDEFLYKLKSLSLLFRGCWEDLVRLCAEIPFGVTEKHRAIIKEIYERSNLELDGDFRVFAADCRSLALKDESVKDLLDKACELYGGSLKDFLIFADIYSRLETFIGDRLFEKKDTAAEPSIKTKQGNTSIPELRFPPNTRWEDIRLKFLDHEAMQILLKGKPQNVKNYIGLGFLDKRTSRTRIEEGKPNRLWAVLAALAKNNGEIALNEMDLQHLRYISKSVSDLRKHLSTLFGINAPAIIYDRRAGRRKYKVVFELSPIDMALFERIDDWVGGSRS